MSYSYNTPTSSPYNQQQQDISSPVDYYNSPVMSDHSPYPQQQSPPYYTQHHSTIPSFAINTTVYTSDCYGIDNSNNGGTGFIPQEMLYNIKQEPSLVPAAHDPIYYNNHSYYYNQQQQQQHVSSHLSEVKARYTKVGIAGRHVPRMQSADGNPMMNGMLPHWVQHSVH